MVLQLGVVCYWTSAANYGFHLHQWRCVLCENNLLVGSSHTALPSTSCWRTRRMEAHVGGAQMAPRHGRKGLKQPPPTLSMLHDGFQPANTVSDFSIRFFLDAHSLLNVKTPSMQVTP